MKTGTLLLLFIFLFVGCNNDDTSCPEIETTPAGSIHMDRGVNYSFYRDGELIEQSRGMLILSKIDNSHVEIYFSIINIYGNARTSTFIDNVVVTGELFDVQLSYESEAGTDRWIDDGQQYALQYVKVDGWMKDTRYVTRGECINNYYNIWDIKIDFRLEDGREYRYEISGTY